jgi:hypothetical protein
MKRTYGKKLHVIKTITIFFLQEKKCLSQITDNLKVELFATAVHLKLFHTA